MPLEFPARRPNVNSSPTRSRRILSQIRIQSNAFWDCAGTSLTAVMGLRRWCDGAQRPVQSLGSFASGFCGPVTSAPQSNLNCSLSVAGKDTTPAAFLLAGASGAEMQNPRIATQPVMLEAEK